MGGEGARGGLITLPEMPNESHVPIYTFSMCRSCAQGGRRCPRSESTRTQERAASARYYQRGLARTKVAQLADAGIPAITDLEMPTTFHQHKEGEPLDLAAGEREVTNPEGASPDKPQGALWSAPGRIDAEGATKTAWTDWSARNEYSGTEGRLIEVTAKPGAVIVHVGEGDDALHLMDRYGTTDSEGNPSYDWEAMRQDGIDGVYVSDTMANPGPPDRSHPSGNFYGWDAESVTWLSTENTEAGETRDVGVYEYEEPDELHVDAEYAHLMREVKVEDGFWNYDSPTRPDLDRAWDRVPKRFRPEETTNAGDPGPTSYAAGVGDSPAPEGSPSGSRGNLYEYTGKGGSASREMDAMDLGSAALGMAAKLKSKKGKKGS